MKKGQMEMMGLVVIAIIASLIMVFTIAYSGDTEETEEHTSFADEILAKKFVGSITNTYVEDCSADYSTLVKDCARGGSINCGSYSGSCDAVEQISEDVISDTLDNWNARYNFTVKGGSASIEHVNDCGGDMEKTSQFQQLPLNPGIVTVKLQICK